METPATEAVTRPLWQARQRSEVWNWGSLRLGWIVLRSAAHSRLAMMSTPRAASAAIGIFRVRIISNRPARLRQTSPTADKRRLGWDGRLCSSQERETPDSRARADAG